MSLAEAVLEFAAETAAIPDNTLDTPWQWQSYKDEGIRFAFFRVYEELLALAAGNGDDTPKKFAETRRILGQYHTAYRDLQAVLWGLDDPAGARPPAEGEWSVQTAFAHIVGADMGFFGILSFSLEKYRTGTWSSEAKITEDDWDRILGLTEAEYNELLSSPLSELKQGHAEIHMRIMTEMSKITNEELDLPVRYWEEQLHPIRWRLHRFTSHMRQHTIQIEKTLAAIDRGSNEAMRLVRQIFGAWAAVENAGATDSEQAAKTAENIQQYTQAIRWTLKKASG